MKVLTKDKIPIIFHDFGTWTNNEEYRRINEMNCDEFLTAIGNSDENNYNQLSSFFQKKRDIFLDAISESRFSFVPSKATYFQLLDYSAISDENDIDFVKRLTKEFKISSIPLSVFNENQLDFKVLRFCFAKKDETLRQAADILNKI
mgnify:CR=1 FL=1